MKFISFLRRNGFVIIWFAWAVLVFVIYYQQIWRIFDLGLHIWVINNDSLASLIEFYRSGMVSPIAEAAFPWALQAVVRAGLGFWGAGLSFTAAMGLGWGVTHFLRWRSDNLSENLLFNSTIGFGLLFLISFGLAVAGIYRPALLRWMILVLAVFTCAIWIFTHRKNRPPTPPVFSRMDWPWIGISVLAVSFALVGALAPEVEFDALSYHLWLPKLWLAQGHPVDLIQEYTSLYPLTWELVFNTASVWGGTIAAKLVHFTCYLLTALLVYQWVKRDFPGTSPWLSAAIYLTIPTVLWEATTAYIDNALALLCGLSFYALVQYRKEDNKRWLMIGAIELGLALATKHTALVVLAILAAGLLIGKWRQDRSPRHALRAIFVLTGISILIALPWYLRSIFASGNPFFPAFFVFFGAFPAQRWDTLVQHQLDLFFAQFGRPRTLLNLLTLPWDMTIHAARYGGTFGPLFLLLLPGLAGLRKNRVTTWLVVFSLLFTVIWATPLSSFQMRLLLPLSPVLGILAGITASQAITGMRNFLINNRAAWCFYSLPAVAIVGLLILNLPPFTSLHEVDRSGSLGWLTHVVHHPPMAVVLGLQDDQDYLRKRVPSYATWQFINVNLPPKALVLTFSDGDHYYSERDRLWSDAVLARPATWGSAAGQESQALSALSRLRVTHILIDRTMLAKFDPATLAIAQPGFIEDNMIQLYSDDRYTLYKLRK